MISREVLEHRQVEGQTADNMDLPCGTIPDLSGWWTSTTPVVNTGTDNEGTFKLDVDNTASDRWKTERLDFNTEQTTGE